MPDFLTFHDFDGAVEQATIGAFHQEMRRYGGWGQSSAIVAIKATRQLRRTLPAASDGLFYRVALYMKANNDA